MSRYYIVVPKSEDEEWNDITDFSKNDSREFTAGEYEELRHSSKIYDRFDENFGTIIDDCEEDEISRNEIERAIAMTDAYLRETPESQAARKLKECLLDAKTRGVGVHFINLP